MPNYLRKRLKPKTEKKKNGSKMLISIIFKVFPLPQNSKNEENIISIFM